MSCGLLAGTEASPLSGNLENTKLYLIVVSSQSQLEELDLIKCKSAVFVFVVCLLFGVINK